MVKVVVLIGLQADVRLK